MRYLLICLFPLFLAAACSDDEAVFPVDQLPPATQTGVGMMACLIDGEPWVNSPDGLGFQGIQTSIVPIPFPGLSIKGVQDPDRDGRDSKNIICKIYPFEEGFTQVDSSSFYYISWLTNDRIWQYPTDNSQNFIEVTRFDEEARIASGIFDVHVYNNKTQDTIHLSYGRFDVNF